MPLSHLRRTSAPDHSSGAPAEAAHPPVGIARVGVEVVGDLAHDGVDMEAAFAESLRADALQSGEHVRPLLVWGLGPVTLPHDHGHHADLAVGHPAHVVLVVPGREAGRLAQFAMIAAAPHHAVAGKASSRAPRSSCTNAAAPSGPSPSRRRRTRAEPTMTPSASAQTSIACPGLDTPRPISTGLSVTALRRFAMTAAEAASEARSPVTPMRPTP